jgi:pseudouridine-5'-phosphate glycosidase
VIAQPIRADVALTAQELEAALFVAEERAAEQLIRGKDVTPFLLRQVAEITEGRSLQANQALIVDNARLAAQIAVALNQPQRHREE